MSRLSVLTVTRKRSVLSSVTGWTAMVAAAEVCRFDDGHISNGIRVSRT